MLFTRCKCECGAWLRRIICSYVLALPLGQALPLHRNIGQLKRGKTLPYSDQIRPQPNESHLWSKGLQYIRVVSTRLLNASPQLSIGQSTCSGKRGIIGFNSGRKNNNIKIWNRTVWKILLELDISITTTLFNYKRREAAVEESWRSYEAYCALTFHYSAATKGLKDNASTQHIQMWRGSVKVFSRNSGCTIMLLHL